jgi:hypothetical protein
VAGGIFDASSHGFANLRVGDVISELEETIEFILRRNPDARFVLTVSPVPLIATMEDRSVLVSTVYSKSVLLVAAEEVAARYRQVAYFPSYEIITGNFSRGNYFTEGLRDVTEAGVSHVMHLFMKHYIGGEDALPVPEIASPVDRDVAADGIRRELAEVAAVLCDEVKLDAEPDKPLKLPALALVGQGEGIPPEGGHPTASDSDESSAWNYLRGASPAPPRQRSPPVSAPATLAKRSLWRSMLSKLWRS